MLHISHDIVLAYAEFTGDRNGLHVSEPHARHYLNGRQVCHGALLVCVALAKLRDLAIDELKVDFETPVCIGDSVATKISQDQRDYHVELVNQHGARCLKIALKVGEPRPRAPVAAGAPRPRRSDPIKNRLDDLHQDIGLEKALEYTDGDIAPAEAEAFCRQQPELFRLLSRLTYVVGMISPGAQSLFSGLRVSRSAVSQEHFTYKLLNVRDNLRLCTYAGKFLDLDFSYSAFVRQEHDSYALDQSVSARSETYKAVRAIVIGGSSGIGARTAEEIIRSGGAVLATGRELRGAEAAAGTKLSLARLDVSSAHSIAVFAAEADTFAPTHLFYMASPRIFERGYQGFSFARLEKFLDIYVIGLMRLLGASQGLSQIPLFWPSTMLLDAHQYGNSEYLTSKSVGEGLLDMLSAETGMKVFRPRLGGFSTGQTSSLLGKPQADELPRLRSVIDEFFEVSVSYAHQTQHL